MADESHIPLETEIRYREKGDDDAAWTVVNALLKPSRDGNYYFNLSLPDENVDYEIETRSRIQGLEIFSDWRPAQRRENKESE